MILIRQATLADEKYWNEYVEQHGAHSPYHLFYWQQAVEKAYSHTPHYLIAKDNDIVVGVFPLIVFKKPLGQKSFCALPFCDVGGILADNEDIKKLLLKESQKTAKKYKVNILELRSSIDNSATTLAKSLGENGEKVRMIMPLPESSETLFSSFKSKLRSQIRKADKNGLNYIIGTDSSMIDDFYNVFSHNMRALGSPVHSKEWFIELQKHYQKRMLISIVYKDKVPIGAGVVLTTNSKASIPWASTKAEFNRLSPNMMLYWSFLKELSDNGISEFDFGRSSFGEGTFKFKQQWGAQPAPLDWQEIDLNIENSSSEKPIENVDSGSNKLRKVVESVWRKLPLQVTIFLGPKIRKYVSL